MPARKSQLQGLKTCNRLGVKKKRRARCTQSERRPRNPLGGIGSELEGRGVHRIAHPKATENMNLEAVEMGVMKKKWIWLIFFFLLLKI